MILGSDFRTILNMLTEVDCVKEYLKHYRETVSKPIHYEVGDIVIVRMATRRMKHIGYVVSINNDDTIIAYPKKNRVCFATVPQNLYMRDNDHTMGLFDSLMDPFIKDSPVPKDVAPGTFVRSRKGCSLKFHSDSPTVYDIFMVMNNKDGKITIVCCVKTSPEMTQLSVYWYELALYDK